MLQLRRKDAIFTMIIFNKPGLFFNLTLFIYKYIERAFISRFNQVSTMKTWKVIGVTVVKIL